MDSIDKDIELGILQGKSIKWCEPHEYIRGASVITEVPLSKFIKWYKNKKKLGLHRNSKYYEMNTMKFIEEFYIVNWAWIK